MADTKISGLGDGGVLQGTDTVAVARGAGNNKVTGANVASYISSATQTFTNKTIDAASNTLSNIDTADVASGSKTGSDTKFVTGTEGTTNQGAKWNADGDLVEDTKIKHITFSSTDTSTSLTTGDAKAFVIVPAELNGYDITAVQADVYTAGTTGTMDIQLHNVTSAADILSTKITIDSTEKSSSTAATAAVINTAEDDLTTGDIIRFDIDAVHTTPAKGLFITLTCTLP
jgi:hypothetical protein